MAKRRSGKMNPTPSGGGVPSSKGKTKSASGGPIRAISRFLGSLKLAVALLVILVIVLAAATLLESSRGTEFSQRYVYHSGWFIALWTLVTLNVLAAVLTRWPRRIRQTGILLKKRGSHRAEVSVSPRETRDREVVVEQCPSPSSTAF